RAAADGGDAKGRRRLRADCARGLGRVCGRRPPPHERAPGSLQRGAGARRVRMSGLPGLCLATLGPGATNLATGVGNAWLDRSPMIAITCNLNTDQLGRRIQLWLGPHALFAPITKASFRLAHGKIVETVNEAIRIALSEP